MSDVSGKINNLWEKKRKFTEYLINRNKAISTKRKDSLNFQWRSFGSTLLSGTNSSLSWPQFYIWCYFLNFFGIGPQKWRHRADWTVRIFVKSATSRTSLVRSKRQKLTRKTLWRGSFEIQSQCWNRLTVEEKRESTLNCRMICVNGT